MDERYDLIIDTDSYSGNFERYMAAYVTGHCDESEVGEEYAIMAKEELPQEISEWFDIYLNRPYGEYGSTHVDIEINPITKKYTSIMIHLCEKPPDDVLETIKERVNKFIREEQKTIILLGYRLRTIRTTEVVEDI